MVALVADVLDSVEGNKHFRVAAGSIEALPAWRMWSEEVVAMGRATEHGSGISSRFGREARVQLALNAARALQAEIIKCPPVAREILTCREMLVGLSCALELEDADCLKEVCEVVILCAQESGARAGDALVSCPKLLNGLCSRAMRTEDPSVIDALTSLSHQNDKMLWIVTTIIKVMRVEKKCNSSLSHRALRAWKALRGQGSIDQARNALVQVTSGSSSSQRMCDVDIPLPRSARDFPPDQTRGVLVYAPKSLHLSPRSAATQRMRDDIIIEPSVQSVSSTIDLPMVKLRTAAQPASLFSSWNVSTPLYSTLNANPREFNSSNQFGLAAEHDSSSSSTLSLPSTTGTETTFRSEQGLAIETSNYSSDQLARDSEGLTNSSLPAARVLPERPWKEQDDRDGVADNLTVPRDSLLYASQQHPSKGAEQCVDTGSGPLAPVSKGRTSSAPPRVTEPSTTLSLMPASAVGMSSIGSPASRAILSTRALSPPRILEPLPYVEPIAPAHVPQAAPGSVCDVDPSLFSYFIRNQEHKSGPVTAPCAFSPSTMSSGTKSRSAGRDASPRVDHQGFHKMADEFAFGRIGMGARMIRGETPPRSRSGRDLSPPATRSIVGASTVQFTNIGKLAPPQTTSLHASSPSSLLHQGQVEMCDVDETPMLLAFTSSAGQVIGGVWEGRASEMDWVGVASTVADDEESDDDWC